MGKGNLPSSSLLSPQSACVSPSALQSWLLVLTPHGDRWFSYLPTMGEVGKRESTLWGIPSLKSGLCFSKAESYAYRQLEFKTQGCRASELLSLPASQLPIMET